MSDVTKRVIIKRPVIAAGHHGGGWKIAYADFMTAMMAFFLVMWLLGLSTPKQLAGIAEQFKMPLKVALTGGPASSNSSTVIPGGGADPTRSVGEVKQPEPGGPESESEKESDKESESGDGADLNQLKQQLDEMIDANPILKEFKPQLLVDITSEGLRIQIVDSNSRAMYDRSSAVVAPYMRTILREFGPVLSAQTNKITLSGHTDSAQYAQGGKSYSNWELSADRANASRRELIAGGMEEKKVLRVMGVASSMHLKPDDPLSPMNRRISIVVLNQRTQTQIETANAASAGMKSAGALQGLVGQRPGSPPAAQP